MVIHENVPYHYSLSLFYVPVQNGQRNHAETEKRPQNIGSDYGGPAKAAEAYLIRSLRMLTCVASM